MLEETEDEPWGWDTIGFEMNFATQMRERRVAKGWSQTELAKRITQEGLKFHQTTVQRIEIGERPLKLTEAMVIASALGVKFETMLRSDSVELAYNELADAVKAGAFHFLTREADSIEKSIKRDLQNVPELLHDYEKTVEKSGGLAVSPDLVNAAREYIRLNASLEGEAEALATRIRATAQRFDALPRDYPPEFHATEA